MTGIYEIVNKINGKRYIGSAKDIKHRFVEHRSLLRNGKHSPKFQHAWDKYGEDSFTFDIIHECPEDMLIVCEQWMIYQYNIRSDLYNSTPTAGNLLGMKHSEETKRKMSIAGKGRKITEEQISKRSENHYMKRITLTPDMFTHLKKFEKGHGSGEKNVKAKLTEQDVKDIRKEYASGNINQTELANRYHIGQDCVSKIVLYKIWKHVI